MHEHIRRKNKFLNVYVLILVLAVFLLFSQRPAEGSEENILYAVALGQPGRVLKVDLNTFQIVDRMLLNVGENGAHAVDITDEYLYVGTLGSRPAMIIQIRLSDFTRVKALTLPSGFDQMMSLHVFGNYLYAGLNSGQVARINASTLTFVDYAESANKKNVRDTVQVGDYLYVVSHDDNGISTLQKLRVSDLSEVARIKLSMIRGHFFLVIGNYLYIASNGVPAGIMKIDLNTFKEIASVQFLTTPQSGYADFVVQYGDYLYANGDLSPGHIYRTRLSDFKFLDHLTLSEDKPCDLEISGKYLYVSNVMRTPASIIKVDLDTFKEVGKLDIEGEGAIPQMAISKGKTPPPPPTEFVTITGRVADTDTSTPISGATVAVDGYSTVTNQSGGYILTNLPLGLYTVSVNAAEYETKNTTLNASSSGVYTVDFQIRKISVSTTITGIVTEKKTKNPIVGALVTANGYSTTTNSAGRYTIMVPPKIYVVTASAHGYEKLSQTVDTRAGGTYTVNFVLATSKDIIPPRITSVTITPSDPTSSDDVVIACKVADNESGLKEVNLLYQIKGDIHWNKIPMSHVEGWYNANIPRQKEGTIVQYYVEASDNSLNIEKSSTSSYTVKAPKEMPRSLFPIVEVMVMAIVFAVIILLWFVLRRR